MKRLLKWIFLIVAGALLIALAAVGWFLSQAGPVGSGFVAKYLCSGTFVSLRDPDVVFEQDVTPINPIAGYFSYAIDHEKRKVTANLGGLFAQTAIYREGCGCTLLVGITEEKMRRQRLVEPGFDRHRPLHRTDLPWPQGNGQPIDPRALGVDPGKLEAAVDNAFSEPLPGHLRNTRAILLVYRGQLIAERYAEGFDRNMPLMGWSMSKSITNALAGILVREGKLDIRQQRLLPQWQENPQKSKITIGHLLGMTSGLAFDEIYEPLHDAAHMLYGSHSFAAYAAAKPLDFVPGDKWQYSSGTSNILAELLRQRMETTGDYYFQYIHDRLFRKIGMTSAVMEPDASATFVGSSYTLATPLDWARFGLLYLQDGMWQGERILPEGWVQYTTTPIASAAKGQYGAHFWLNAGSAADPDNRLWPNAPRDTFAAQGYQDQRVIVIPSRTAVLVRFGATSDNKAWDTDAFIQQVLAALPLD